VLAVSNSSPLIALSAIGRLELLPALFESVLIPPAVAVEIGPLVSTSSRWLRVRPLERLRPAAVVRRTLGPGETEALALALEVRPDRLILDDLPARRLAEALGLPIIGTLGIVLAAKRRGLIASIRPLLDDLVSQSFFITAELIQELLESADETER
jgi:predicted nucleic acid-binding protein